jgi:hypothetical protein
MFMMPAWGAATNVQPSGRDSAGIRNGTTGISEPAQPSDASVPSFSQARTVATRVARMHEMITTINVLRAAVRIGVESNTLLK